MGSVLKLEADEEITRRIQSLCLLGKLTLDNRVGLFTPESVKSLTTIQWRCKNDYKVSYIQPNMFMFSFQDDEDFKQVLVNTPYTIRGFLLVLSPWISSRVPSELHFAYSPFWVQVHGLPFNYFTKENRLKIAQLLGKPMSLDENVYDDLVWRRYLRIRVILDIRKPLLSGFWQNRSGLPDIWISFKYEKLGAFCYKCGHISKHLYNKCDSPEGKVSYGPWMRAYPFVNNNRDGCRRLGGSSSVAGREMVVQNTNTVVQGIKNRFANLASLDEIEATVLIPADNTEVRGMVKSEEKHISDEDDSAGVVPCRFSMLMKVIKNIIGGVIMVGNCKMMSSRVGITAVAAANNNNWSFFILMVAYLIYLLKAFVYSTNSLRLKNHYKYNPIPIPIPIPTTTTEIMLLFFVFFLLYFFT